MRRLLITAFISTGFALPLAIAACGDDGGDNESFDNFQACYDDHLEEGMPSDHAIATCCLDHPIAGHDPGMFCPGTQAECEAALDADLDDSVTSAMIALGCMDYITQKDM